MTLRRLYDRYGDTGEITWADYAAMGGMRRVVHNVVDEVLSAESEQRDRQLAELRAGFIPWLATIADNDEPVRRVTRWSDLPEPSRPVIDAFVEKRLLVKDQRGGEVVVEVALESLLRQWDDLAGWLRDQREDLKAAGALELPRRGVGRRPPQPRLAADRHPPGRRGRIDRQAGIPPAVGIDPRLPGRVPADRQSKVGRRTGAPPSRTTGGRDKQATAEKHAAALRKRSRILIAVLTVTAVIAVTAVALGMLATTARQQAEINLRAATAQKLNAQAQGMLAGTTPGGDARAFQQILAARTLDTPNDGVLYTAVVQRASTLKIITGHTDRVRSVVFSSDGHWLASASKDATVRLWNPDTGQPIGAPLTGHTGPVGGVAFSPDGHRLATAGEDARYGCGTPTPASRSGTPSPATPAGCSVWCLAPTGTGWPPPAPTPRCGCGTPTPATPFGDPLTGHSDIVFSVGFSPDGHRLVSPAPTPRCGCGIPTPANRSATPATPARCGVWRSAPTGTAWPPSATMARCGCGTPTATNRSAPPSPATPAR